MNEELKQLGDEYWEYRLEASPSTASMLGDHRYDELFDDFTRAGEDAEIARLREYAARAEAIDPSLLSSDEQVSRDVLVFEASTKAADLETRQAELAVNHAIGLQANLPVFVRQLPIMNKEHADALVVRFAAMGRAFDQATERLREGIANGRTPPAFAVGEVITQLDEHLATPLEEDPYLDAPAPPSFNENAVAEWKARLQHEIAEHIRPAYRRQRHVLHEEVLPAARPDDKPGVVWLEDGEELYRRAIHRHTSLPLDAQAIHEIGLEHIESLADEYRVLGQEVLGTTDLSQIFSRLRDDPDLHFTNGPEIVAASETAMAKAKTEMGDWFGRLPQADCVVKETQTGPTAFYFPPAADGSRPGTFFINTADPTRWGRFEIEAMAYHEGIPGHHLQLAIAGELEGQPEFRKRARITAYAEGWGLYTERLADEMGLYSGPLERIGMLSADSMRAGRLVLDTGLHAMGWSRQQAIEYFARNSPMSMGTIESEVDRYIGFPGQALAYMIGRREIMSIRDDAAETMGDAFDIQGFHDTVLGSGLMPLSTLARVVADWAAGAG